jgi:ribosomal RNA-processing protein 36
MRTVIEPLPKVAPRDPRFDPALSSHLSHTSAEATRKRYDFLSSYRASEQDKLRKIMKDPKKGPDEKEAAKREWGRLQGIKLKEHQEQKEREVKAEFNSKQREREKREKERAGDGDGDGGAASKELGKGPEKQAERIMEKKRRKRAGKERRFMPSARR